MESWLILMGVLLPLVPLLQIAERRLATPARRRGPVEQPPARG